MMDVDSTFITAEQIDELARYAGAGDQVAAITERAMRGQLDFAAALRERVAALAGLPAGVLDDVAAGVRTSPGGTELVAAFTERGWPVALVSGGFHEIIDPLAAAHGIDYVRANRLGVSNGVLTGNVQGPIIDRAAKEHYLREVAAAEGIALEDAVAVGDGANDLDMVTAAGLGVGYRPKEALAVAADLVLTARLDELLTHLPA